MRGGWGDHERADSVAAIDHAALLELREGFADRRAADFKALAQLGLGGQHAIVPSEIARFDPREDFLYDLACEGDTSANHVAALPERLVR